MIHLGANLVPEALETGEYKIASTVNYDDDLQPYYVIAYLASEITLEGTTYHFTGGTYNGILNGILFIVGDKDQIEGILYNINVTQGLGENIMTVFSIPKFACARATNNPAVDGKNYAVLSGNEMTAAITKTLSARPTSLDGYTPKNGKMKTFPYMYFAFNPQNGTQKEYRYENFTDNTPQFKMICEINQDPNVFFVPQNYKGITGDNVSECASLGGYPNISWKTDYYNSWLAQNSNFIKLDLGQASKQAQMTNLKSLTGGLTSLMSAKSSEGENSGYNVGGAASGVSGSIFGMAGNVLNYDYYVQRQLAQIELQKILPDKGSLGSSNTTLLGYNLYKNIFNVYTIKSQFAQKIDHYFDMYRICYK